MTTKTQAEEALLPCPFCGGAAELNEGRYDINAVWHYVNCTVCEATACGPHHDSTVANAISRWNTRLLTQADKPDGMVPREKQFDGKTFRIVGGIYNSIEDIRITVLDMSYPIEAAADGGEK